MHFLCFHAVSVVIYPQNRVYLSVFCVQYDTDFNAGKLSAFFLGKRSETNQESSVAVSCSGDRRVPSFLSGAVWISGKTGICRAVAGVAGRLGVVMKEKKRDWAISAGFLGVLLTAYVINYRFGFLEILDFHIEKVKKAYPAYFGIYDRMGELTAWLNKIENLFCIGRNGQHRYNNMDHSMMTAFCAVDLLLAGSADKEHIWSVNTEKAYHEKK